MKIPLNTRYRTNQRWRRICPASVTIHSTLRYLRAMRRVTILAALLFAVSTCQAAVYPTPEMRERNWPDSCVWSATATALNMAGRPQGAAHVRKYYRGGASLQRLATTLQGFGLTVRTTYSGDASFLETTNCAIIDFGPTRKTRHAVVFCGYEGNTVIISDPNGRSLQAFTKSSFIRHWEKSGGRAVALD